MNDKSVGDRDAIEELADSFAARFRAGERPSVEEYAQRYPELADQLRELLPALVLLEQHALPEEQADNTPAAGKAGEPSIASPREIGDFTIVREIGRGGMGVVYEAIQESLGRHVALKVLSAPALLNPLHLERFRLEARAAARLHHSHIVPVFGVGEHNGLHYYAMQFIQGQSLDLVIDALAQLRRGVPADKTAAAAGATLTWAAADGLVTGQFHGDRQPDDASVHTVDSRDCPSFVAAGEPAAASGTSSPPAVTARPSAPVESRQTQFTSHHSGREFYRSVARVGLQVTEALAYAHSEGVLHRDIKPSNLLLDAKGNVWITDFGLAKAEGTEGLTHTGDFVGTLRYMAPERLEGAFDRRSDLYGLGATLYELLTQRPFLGTASRGRLVDKILHEEPLPPSKVDSALPRDLETIVLKSIAKEPAARYRTADALAEDLRRFLADRPILARRSTTTEQFVRWCRRNPLIAGLAGAVITLLGAAVVILTMSNATIRRESAAKDSALATARDAVHQMLTRVASERFSDMPMSHPLRVALLQDALEFYEGLIAESPTDDALHEEVADVLHTMAGLERELDRYGDAARSLQRSAAMLRRLVDSDANPPAIREKLASVELDLAYTWQWETNPPGMNEYQVEAQYRRALALLTDLERDFPERRQPMVLCLRSLAGLAHGRGNHAEARRLWREAVSRGEAFLKQHADSINAGADLCWACVEFYDALLGSLPDTAAEAESVLVKGLQHAETMLDQNPQSTQAADVAAALRFRLALAYCRNGRVDEAVPVLHQAIDGIEQLCAEFPWDRNYWNSLRWFQSASIEALQEAGRDDEAQSVAKGFARWLRQTAPQVPDEPASQGNLQRTHMELVELLRAVGENDEADELARFVAEIAQKSSSP